MNSMKQITLAALAVLCAVFVTIGCDRPAANDGADAGDRIRIATTVGMVTDIVARVAGERAVVTGIMPTGTDPHLYLPSRADVADILGADMVFYNGLLLEGRMTDVITRTANEGKPVHAVTESIDASYLLEPPEFEGHPDPHVWMDPSAWANAVESVRDQLIAHDPAGEAVYRTNTTAALAEIQQLEAYCDAVLSTVPEHRRVLVTAHDAFNYFGRRFNFEVVGIQGISTDSEAGVRDIERIVTLLVDKQIPSVFVESTVAERNVRALVDGAKAQGQPVTIGGSLYSDAMGSEGTWEGTYIGMIDHNVTTIVRALGGEAPSGGLRAWIEEQP